MSTPRSKITDVFHTKFQSTYIMPYELESQFLINAISEFELDLYKLEYDESLEMFEDDLSRPEINLLGMLMYKSYLGRERDRILKLNNIVGKDIKLTSMADSKRTMGDAVRELDDEIDDIKNKLKNNSFYE